MRQHGHEIRRGSSRRKRGHVAARALVDDAIDAPEVVRFVQLVREHIIAQVLRHVPLVLDDPAIHVHDIERAVWSDGEVDGTEALVGGREKFSPHLAIRLRRGETVCRFRKLETAYEVDRRIDDKHVPVQLCRQPVAAIDHRRADRRIFRERPIGPQNAVLIPAIDAAGRPDRPHLVQVAVWTGQRFMAAARAQQIRVAHEIAGRNQIHMQRGFVRIPENPPGIVLRDSPLPARQRLQDLERTLPWAQVDVDFRCVDMIVEPPHQAVRVVLDVRFLTPVLIRHELLAIGTEIAVRILKQPQVRRLCDEHAAVEYLQPSRQNEPLLKHGALVHPSIGIGVFEHDNLPDRRVLAAGIDVGHVSGHLDRPQAPLAIPVDHDRVLNQRLARNELDAIPRRHVELLERFLGRKRRRIFGNLLQARRPRAGDLRIAHSRRGQYEQRNDLK